MVLETKELDKNCYFGRNKERIRMEKFIGHCILLGLTLWLLTNLVSGVEDNQEEKGNNHKGRVIGILMIISIYEMITVITIAPKITSTLS